MNNEASSIIKKAAEAEVERIKQQLATNTPESLTNTGTETAITEIPSSGYIINAPGTYVISKDIVWNPVSDAIAAIVIQCSNVVLDFNGHKITQSEDPNPMVYGVAVYNLYQTCSYVTIKNGIINNMGISGIWAVDTDYLIIKGMTIEDLNYNGYDQLPAAFTLFMCRNFGIDNCIAKNISVTAKMAGGFMIMSSNIGTLNNCTIENFTNNDGVACGFPYVVSDNIWTTSCEARSLTTFSANNAKSNFGHTCIGYMVTDCKGLTYKDCSAHHMHGCCDDCHGMSMWPGHYVEINNFTAHDVHDGLGPQKTGAKATGIEVAGTNIKVTNCTVENITAIRPQFLQATGYSACGTNITFKNCTATGVKVLDADGNPNTSVGYGTGYGWAPDPRITKPAAVDISYLNCVADDCQLGFDTWDHQQSKWEGVSISNTPLPYLIQPTGKERVLRQNFCSELKNSFPGEPGQTYIVKNVIDSATNLYPSDWKSSKKSQLNK
jgi:hypothetical protein